MRLANVYFLIIAILQSIPQIAPLSAVTAWIPLIVVLAISMIREGTHYLMQVWRILLDAEKTGALTMVLSQW